MSLIDENLSIVENIKPSTRKITQLAYLVTIEVPSITCDKIVSWPKDVDTLVKTEALALDSNITRGIPTIRPHCHPNHKKHHMKQNSMHIPKYWDVNSTRF